MKLCGAAVVPQFDGWMSWKLSNIYNKRVGLDSPTSKKIYLYDALYRLKIVLFHTLKGKAFPVMSNLAIFQFKVILITLKQRHFSQMR